MASGHRGASSASPRLRVEFACRHLGRDEFIARCAAVLEGGDEDPDFIVTIGGAPALRLLGAGIPEDQRYWLRVWAARGLLWAGPPNASGALRAGLGDGAWRVREMTCKVVARHRVEELFDDVVALEVDSVSRVRHAATRAIRRMTELVL